MSRVFTIDIQRCNNPAFGSVRRATFREQAEAAPKADQPVMVV